MTQILSFLQGSCPPGCVSDDSKLHDYLDSSSKGLYKDIRHLGNPPLFSSSMDGTTKRKLAGDVLALKKLKGMSGGLITPEDTVITDCNHIALYNQNVTGTQGRVISTQSDYGYDLGLEEETTNSARPR